MRYGKIALSIALFIVRQDAETLTITAAWRLTETRSRTIYNIRTSANMERRRRFLTCAVQEVRRIIETG